MHYPKTYSSVTYQNRINVDVFLNLAFTKHFTLHTFIYVYKYSTSFAGDKLVVVIIQLERGISEHITEHLYTFSTV